MNLAVSLKKIGRLEKALENCLKAQKIFENHYGTSHVESSFLYHNLGWIYIDLKEYDQAKSFTEKALTIQKREFGLTHQNTNKT
jgi:tetratricopeptide (TPR) repeat protein